ncbi:MAG: primosomal protein N' [Elusimicrobia bacterium]|nr:primosomal protein N' [Elusimicrobiota bacterium]
MREVISSQTCSASELPEALSVAEVALPIPVFKSFHYLIPEQWRGVLRPGHRVRVPFGSRSLCGWVFSLHRESPWGRLKPIAEILGELPCSEDLLGLASWLSRRAACPLGEALRSLVPSFLSFSHRESSPPEPPGEATHCPESPVCWTEEQRQAVSVLESELDSPAPRPTLLYGVTASGKTEVYLHLIQKALGMRRQALLLLPEISLTPQFQETLSRRFGTGVALWHSRMPATARRRVWQGVAEGRLAVVFGARSAVLLPFRNLGLAILDEEQEGAYKQDQKPRYHARDAALKRAADHRALVVLGSATPSLETYFLAQNGSYRICRMSRRVSGSGFFPQVRAVDMRREKNRVLSASLLEALSETLARGEQAILFVNRRGYSSVHLCRLCGWVAKCPRCGVSLVVHRQGAPQLRCHHCIYRIRVPESCPQCKGRGLAFLGGGTQKIVAEIGAALPQARILRMDRDALSRHSSPQGLYQEFKDQKAQILVGTQMLAKGFHFPQVTLVGVADADTALRLPDFRSAERTVQLLTQVAGRAGRGERPGKVLLQTYDPDHYALKAAAAGDYSAFCEEELRIRRQLGYPPFMFLVRVLVSGKNQARAEAEAEKLAQRLRERAAGSLQVLGPAPAAYARLRSRYRFHLLLKGPSWEKVEPYLEEFSRWSLPSSVRVTVDVDPQDLL